MKTITVLFTTITLMLGPASSRASAQAFSVVLEKLDKIEKQVKRLETTQERDTRRLKARLSSAQAGPDASGLDSTLAAIRTQIDRMDADLTQVKTHVDRPENNGTAALVVELRELIGELRTTAEKSPGPEAEIKVVSSPESGSAPDVSIDVGADIFSQYVWRGYRLADRPSVQPSVTLSFGETGFAFNIWGSVATQGRGAPRSLEEADELDFTLSYDRSFGEEGKAVGLSLGYIQYTFPNLMGTKHSEEVYAGISADNPVAPSLMVYYDFGMANAWYVTAGISPEISLNREGTVSLGLGGSVGFGEAAGSFGFNDLSLSASLAISRRAFTISPTIGFSYADDAVNIDNSEFWGGVGISFSH